MKSLVSMLAVVVSLAALVVSAEAQMMGDEGMMERTNPRKERGMGQKAGRERHEEASYGEGPFDIEAMKERLKLTDDQMAKLKKLRSGYSKEMIRSRADLRIAELDLFELLDAKTLDMEAAEKKVKELEALQSGLWIYRIRALKDTSRFLTEAQFDQFREMGFKFMRRMMGRHGKGSGMGGGQGQGMMGGGGHEE